MSESEEGSSTEFGLLLDQLKVVGELLAPQEPLEASLGRIARLAVDCVAGCDTSGVSLIGHGGISTRAATGRVAVLMDECQYLTDEGPCLDAIRGKALVRVPDLGTEQRWQAFTPMARKAGIVSILAIPFPRTDSHAQGALNLYSATQPFCATDERAVGLAVLAALAINHGDNSTRMEDLVDDLREALESRDVIGEAKGIIMERHQVTSGQAFDLLHEASQQQNAELGEIAERLVSTGMLAGTRENRVDSPGEQGGLTP